MTERPPDRRRELNDSVLWPLIEAADDAARELALESIVTRVVKPTVKGFLKRFRRAEPSLQPDDVEDIASLVTLRVIRKLRATARLEEHAIAALEGYVATMTSHALYDLRRQRHPERHKLKKHLRYVMTHDRRLALWETPAGVTAGLASWKGQVKLHTFPQSPAPTAEMADRDNPGDAIVAIVQKVGAPLTFDALVDVVANLWHVRDVVLENTDFPPDEQRDQLSSLEQREYMEALWSEIRDLPEKQRAALLLNLRDSAGANAMALFLLLGIADASEIAGATGMTEQQLIDMWERLPLDDLTIAARLDLSRQQVINLRKSARSRLTRRMSAWK